MEEVKVIGVSHLLEKQEYYVYLANGQNIRVARKEYLKMQKRLSGKSGTIYTLFVETEETP